MSDRVVALMQVLQTAQTDEARQWIAMQFNLDSLSPEVREVVWVAAIPEWFDKTLLDTLLEQPISEADFDKLTSLSYVEPFPLNSFFNVHESTRELLLAKLYQDDPQRYRELNFQAAKYCEQKNQDELHWKIATLYHQALAGFVINYKINNQAVDWITHSQRCNLEALIFSLSEEIKANRINDDIKAETYIWKNWEATSYAQANTLLRLADYSSSCSSSEEQESESLQVAHDAYQLALSRFEKIKDKRGVANCTFRLGDVYLKQSKLDESQKRYEQAQLLFRQLDDKLSEAHCFHSLGEMFSAKSQLDEAQKQYKKALKLFRDIEDRLGEENCVQDLGNISLGLSDFEKAENKNQEALSYFQGVGYRRGIASCTASLGDVSLGLSQLVKAETQYEEALSLYKSIGHKRGETYCTKRLGDVYLQLFDLEKAQEKYESALRLSQHVEDRVSEAYCIQGLGDIYLQRSELDKVSEQYKKAQDMFRKIGDRRGEAKCTKNLGKLFSELGDIENAISHMKKAANIYRDIRLVVNQAGCFNSIAKIYHSQKRYDDALAAYQQAIEICPEGKYWYHKRAHTYIAMEQYDLALQDIERAEKTGMYLEYLQAFRGEIALWQHQPQTAVDLLQSATQQRPKDGGFQRTLALALLANGNAEAFATMETGLKLTYRKKDIERTLEELDKLERIYGERAEFAQMREVLTNYLNQNFQH